MADDLICPKGQYVMLITDDYYRTIEIYNCYGENTCRFSKYIGPHSPVYIVPEKILELGGSFGSDFWNLETGKMIGSFPLASARVAGNAVRNLGVYSYAVAGNTCWYETADGPVSQEIPEGEQLVSISETFMETRDASGSLHLYDRETGMELTWSYAKEGFVSGTDGHWITWRYR